MEREGSVNGIRNGMTVPARFGDERTTLMGSLQRLRDLVAWKVAGASDEALRSARMPSGLTLFGVVRHLENVERWWFRSSFAGEEGLFDWSVEDPSGEFDVPRTIEMRELLASYAQESARCDAVVAAASSLDARSAIGDFSLRWVIIHMIQETARHLGHMDLLRERADGAVGEEPDRTPA